PDQALRARPRHDGARADPLHHHVVSGALSGMIPHTKAQAPSFRGFTQHTLQPVERPVRTTADWLLRGLRSLGVEEAFGLTGGAIAPLTDALANSGLRTYHFRHEGGAG